MPINELVVLHHSLVLERKELERIDSRIEKVNFTKNLLQNVGLDITNVDFLIQEMNREKEYSIQTIKTLNTLIPDKVDKNQLRLTIKEFLNREGMTFKDLAKEINIPSSEIEIFLKTGNADDYLIMKLFDYFQLYQ